MRSTGGLVAAELASALDKKLLWCSPACPALRNARLWGDRSKRARRSVPGALGFRIFRHALEGDLSDRWESSFRAASGYGAYDQRGAGMHAPSDTVQPAKQGAASVQEIGRVSPHVEHLGVDLDPMQHMAATIMNPQGCARDLATNVSQRDVNKGGERTAACPCHAVDLPCRRLNIRLLGIRRLSGQLFRPPPYFDCRSFVRNQLRRGRIRWRVVQRWWSVAQAARHWAESAPRSQRPIDQTRRHLGLSSSGRPEEELQQCCRDPMMLHISARTCSYGKHRTDSIALTFIVPERGPHIFRMCCRALSKFPQDSVDPGPETANVGSSATRHLVHAAKVARHRSGFGQSASVGSMLTNLVRLRLSLA